MPKLVKFSGETPTLINLIQTIESILRVHLQQGCNCSQSAGREGGPGPRVRLDGSAPVERAHSRRGDRAGQRRPAKPHLYVNSIELSENPSRAKATSSHISLRECDLWPRGAGGSQWNLHRCSESDSLVMPNTALGENETSPESRQGRTWLWEPRIHKTIGCVCCLCLLKSSV